MGFLAPPPVTHNVLGRDGIWLPCLAMSVHMLYGNPFLDGDQETVNNNIESLASLTARTYIINFIAPVFLPHRPGEWVLEANSEDCTDAEIEKNVIDRKEYYVLQLKADHECRSKVTVGRYDHGMLEQELEFMVTFKDKVQ